MEYLYTKTPVNVGRLAKEISDSAITIALDYINHINDSLTVKFKANLSNSEKEILDNLVLNHTGEPLPEGPNKVEITNEIIDVSSTGEPIPTWTQLKTFYNSLSRVANLNYFDYGSFYYIWMTFRDQKFYIPRLVKGTADCNDFEANYKSRCNTPEFPRVRTTTCKAGRKLHQRFISFKTSSMIEVEPGVWRGNFDNTDDNDNDWGDVTYILKKKVNNELVTITDPQEMNLAVETWLDFEPPWTIELRAGDLEIPEVLDGNDDDKWEAHVIAIPDIPESQGGRISFISNPRLKFKKGKLLVAESRDNPSELPYSPIYHTNKIRIKIKHPQGAQSEFQVHFDLYK